MRPGFGTRPVIRPESHSVAPLPLIRKREKPGRSRMPAASHTARHSSSMRFAQGPARPQVCVASSDVSSPGWAYHIARSQPL
ncbi:hypothetical protein D3C86_1908830 [compost metagenome]